MIFNPGRESIMDKSAIASSSVIAQEISPGITTVSESVTTERHVFMIFDVWSHHREPNMSIDLLIVFPPDK
jgi:hypothetical protein